MAGSNLPNAVHMLAQVLSPSGLFTRRRFEGPVRNGVAPAASVHDVVLTLPSALLLLTRPEG